MDRMLRSTGGFCAIAVPCDCCEHLLPSTELLTKHVSNLTRQKSTEMQHLVENKASRRIASLTEMQTLSTLRPTKSFFGTKSEHPCEIYIEVDAVMVEELGLEVLRITSLGGDENVKTSTLSQRCLAGLLLIR